MQQGSAKQKNQHNVEKHVPKQISKTRSQFNLQNKIQNSFQKHVRTNLQQLHSQQHRHEGDQVMLGGQVEGHSMAREHLLSVLYIVNHIALYSSSAVFVDLIYLLRLFFRLDLSSSTLLVDSICFLRLFLVT